MVVVDSSVIVKWFFEEEGSEAARRLLRESTLGAPDLLLYEFSNVVACRPYLSEKEASELMDVFLKTQMEYFALPHSTLKRAVSLAKHYRISGYDASFVALAESLATDLVTADRKLAQKVKSLSSVHLLVI